MEPRRHRKSRVESVVTILSGLICATGFASVFPYVSSVYAVSFSLLCALSVYGEYRKSFFPPRWLLNIFSLAVIGVSVVRVNRSDPVIPILEALILLLAIKFLEKKTSRDYLQIYVIALFLLAGSALQSIDLVFMLYFLVLIVLLTLAVVFLTYFSQDPAMELEHSVIARIFSKALLIPALALPLTIVLFFVLPRTNYPLFAFLNAGEAARTGFSDNVKLGSVSDIQEDTSILFRAKMDKIDDASLYWRGLVLDSFDGRQWSASKEKERGGGLPHVKGKQIRQTIFLEYHENRYLRALDAPLAITSLRNIRSSGDFTFSSPLAMQKRLRYDVVSVPSGAVPAASVNRQKYLQLPEGISPGIAKVARELSSPADSKKTVRALLRFLREGDYKYSLKNLPVSRTPLEDFLFRYKYGNCEYFASAMAVLLRASKIPARLIGGYRGGYYNDVGGYYIIPQKNSHVWVEAYLENEGWIRLDPTPASMENFTSLADKKPILRIALILDTLHYYWNALVINYDFDKQFSLFRQFRSSIRNPSLGSFLKNNSSLLWGLFSVFIIIIVLRTRPWSLTQRSREEKVVRLFLRKMDRYGYRKGPSEGLEEFTSKIQEGPLRERVWTFVMEFEKKYYKDERLSKEETAVLQEMVKAF